MLSGTSGQAGKLVHHPNRRSLGKKEKIAWLIEVCYSEVVVVICRKTRSVEEEIPRMDIILKLVVQPHELNSVFSLFMPHSFPSCADEILEIETSPQRN